VTAEARTLGEPFPGVAMNQWSARARGSLFAVGYAELPRAGPEMHAALGEALVRNISGTVTLQRELELGDARGRETLARGVASQQPVLLRLRLYQRAGRLYQVTVLGPPEDLSEDELETFFGSFRFRDATGQRG
jgi:hypothetical protein